MQAILAVLMMCVLPVSDLDDGTLLFIKNGRGIVQRYTNSEYTHVGIIFNEDGEPWVYEATPPRVRKVKLSTYYREMIEWNDKHRDDDDETPAELWIYRPLVPYSEEQVRDMRTYLQSQMGRRYSIGSYLFNQVRKGCHCSELTSNTLNRTGLFQFRQTYGVSPGQVEKEVRPRYGDPLQVVLPRRIGED